MTWMAGWTDGAGLSRKIDIIPIKMNRSTSSWMAQVLNAVDRRHGGFVVAGWRMGRGKGVDCVLCVGVMLQ